MHVLVGWNPFTRLKETSRSKLAHSIKTAGLFQFSAKDLRSGVGPFNRWSVCMDPTQPTMLLHSVRSQTKGFPLRDKTHMSKLGEKDGCAPTVDRELGASWWQKPRSQARRRDWSRRSRPEQMELSPDGCGCVFHFGFPGSKQHIPIKGGGTQKWRGVAKNC